MPDFNKRPRNPYDPTPDREPPNPNAKYAKGTGKPRRTAEDKAILNQRIESVRSLLRLGMTSGDIRRAMAPVWNVKPKSVNRFIGFARKRNLEAIEESEDTLLAASIGWWMETKRNAMQTASKAAKRVEHAETEIEEATEVLNSDASDELRSEAVQRLKIAAKILDDARRTGYTARKEAMDCQDRYDKLLALGKPSKHALTDKHGNDVLPLRSPPEPEPVSTEQTRKELESLFRAVNRRDELIASGKTLAEAIRITDQETR